ncbi:MAG: Ig-like domain-containing protein, partial [Anaerolineales bacterium]
MLTGLLEFGFALNQYLNALDAAREGARFASDGDPTQREAVVDCGTTHDFYVQASCVAEQTMRPIDLNPARDDIVISVFRVLNGHVISRWPNCTSAGASDCPNDPPVFSETGGEWHRFGQGSQCSNGLDDDHDGAIDDGCVNAGSSPFPPPESTCLEATDITCHISRFSSADIEARLDPTAPNTAVMLVEVFYAYDQILKLPWITAFVPDPVKMHSYTIIPVPAAEPSLAISGTVLHTGGTPFAGVTINFSTGAVAVTDANGNYDRKGFDSGSITVTPSFPGCTFNPPNYNVVLVNQDVSGVDFRETVCIPTATPTSMPSQTETPNPLMTSTPTSTYTPTPTSTNTQTPTRTPTPSNTPNGCSIGVFDASKSTVTIITPPTGIVQADNTSTAQIVVTARDNCFNLMANLPVTLASSRGGTDSISPGSANTNASGQVVFTVKSAVMSPWDTNTSVFTPSVFKATLNSVLLTDHADIKFVCVRGEGLPAGGPNEVFWQFTNSSTIPRRLVQLDIAWPQETGRLLQEVRFGGTTIWALGANFSPITINSNWVGAPTSRDIADTVAKSLLVTFNFLVTGSQEYTVKAYWDDTNGASICDSGSVTVIRAGAGTSVPTSPFTSTPQATITPSPTRTNTPVPINPTATNTGLVPTATSTSTSTSTSAVPTATPTATRTNTPAPPTN